MLCRVEMPSNEQIFGRFYRWRLLHRGAGGARVSLILLPILSALAAFMLWRFNGGILIPLVIVGVVAFYLANTLYLRPNALFRKREGAALQTEVYIFTETGFTRSVRSEEGGPPESTSSQYDVLVEAVETAHDFYLFTSPTQAYAVDKEYFTKGSPEELRGMLQKKLGDKKFRGKGKKKG